jgi:hypothetical protein
LTAQYGFGPLILELETLERTDFTEKVYGGSFRYTAPHWRFKGEYFEGAGPKNGSGSYIDATYRIPSHSTSEIVIRLEQVRAPGSDDASQLATFGIRHIFNRYITANLNYGWGKELEYSPYAANLSLGGWTARVMFQVPF